MPRASRGAGSDPSSTRSVPNGCPGFADNETGRLELARILIPAGTAAEANVGIAAARRFGELLRTTPAVHLVHVGPISAAFEGLGVVRIGGHIDEAIVTAAQRIGASLIVMPTHGHDGLADVLSGTHTEHVIHTAGLPVLVIPA
jgi:hypothetical protein